MEAGIEMEEGAGVGLSCPPLKIASSINIHTYNASTALSDDTNQKDLELDTSLGSAGRLSQKNQSKNKDEGYGFLLLC